MSQISKRIKQFQIEIRREERHKIKSKYRNDFITSLAINQSFSAFLQSKDSQIPMICLQGISVISEQLLERFVYQIQSLAYFMKENQNQAKTWFFNCQSKNNLKFMTQLSKVSHHKLLDQRIPQTSQSNNMWSKCYAIFFQSTIKANYKYSTLSFNFQLQVKDSKCYIEAYYPVYQEAQQSSVLSSFHQNYNQGNWLAVLEFWSTYMKLWEICDVQNYIVSIKAFLLWFQHAQIHQHQQAYVFIYSILKFIKESKLLPPKKSSHHKLQELTKVLQVFLNRMKRCVPFVFAKKTFLYLGKIAYQLLMLSEQIQGIMSELLFRSQTLIFKLPLQKQNLQRIKVGLNLAYVYISFNNILHFNSPLKKVEMFKKFITDYLFHPQLQPLVAQNFSQLAQSDLNSQMKQLFEEIDFQKLLQLNNSDSQYVFYLAIDTLSLFRQNILVHNKILKNGELIKKVRLFSETYDRQEIFIDLIKAIDSNIEYYADNYTNQLNQITDYARQLQFQGRDAFLNQAAAYIDLKNKQAAL